MEIPISIIFLFASLIAFWIIPAIGIAKNHLVDDRFFIRQWLFPMQYWLQLLFERISGNRRIVVRILQIMSLFITYFCGLLMLMIFSVFDGNLLKHPEAFLLFEYLLVSSITYWFQPKAGKVYKTK
ncbi:hypothetical protein IMAU30025_01898 [Lactobacillus helveticus]|uniref:hypothetical protein n=1 Tax=Lactobacillus helveticus TaxID=1587 RepID=UPI0015626707|nr:hypothetical protein [Lactobacillus helveticus]NRN89818.1 hypothetical protein [Lactobacillus helveticus]NRN94716.1 hypothetical protein [Lactobacillus helveticus]NRO26974.1 hypothetical protein [Lactobacillus helveticus]NRO31680.1 hypothetical protein [Lactobacillus helveticus]NRO37392.1 hypothetical protein [Lactobacillus helveticus]